MPCVTCLLFAWFAPQGKAKITKTKLNVSWHREEQLRLGFAFAASEVADVQKGTFVHMAGRDYSKDAIGEVKALESGKLQVEVQGKEVILASARSFPQ